MDYIPPLGSQDPEAPYVDGNPATGVEGSPVPAAALEHPQREIREVISDAGLVPDAGDLTQLRQAIDLKITAAQSSHPPVIEGATFEGTVTDGQVVYWDDVNNRFDKALADGTDRQDAVGIADVTNAEVRAFGRTPAGLVTGLADGATCYLSGTVAGALTATKPASNVVKVGVAHAADVLFVDVDEQPRTTGVLRQRKTVTDTVNRSTSSTAFESTGVSVQFDQPVAPGSIVRVTVEFTFGADATRTGEFKVYRDIGAGDVAIADSKDAIKHGNNGWTLKGAITFWDAAPGTATTKYTLYWKTNAGTIFLGRQGFDIDPGADKAPTRIIIEEYTQ